MRIFGDTKFAVGRFKTIFAYGFDHDMNIANGKIKTNQYIKLEITQIGTSFVRMVTVTN